MSRYIITIEPTDPKGNTSEGAQATIRIDTGPPAPRIIEMTLRSSAPPGLTSAALPIIDLAGVVEALRSGIHRSSVASESAALSVTNQTGSENSPSRAGSETDGHSGPLDNNMTGEVGESRDGRAYRRMPQPDELQKTYERIGTVTGVARHYGVPRHTAQGWMTRLRKLAATHASQSTKSQTK